MNPHETSACTAFADGSRIASGDMTTVAVACKRFVDSGDDRTLLVFDDATAQPVEMDLRGDEGDVLRRLAADSETAPADDQLSPAETRRVGRPKLGVVGREVTLLPRHWEWLNAQPGGASVALRKLVDKARRDNEADDRVRRSQEAAYRFMLVMAGNERGFEEATRALFAGDRSGFEARTESWPTDVKDYASRLAEDAFVLRSAEEGRAE